MKTKTKHSSGSPENISNMQTSDGGTFSASDRWRLPREQQENSWLCWINTTGWQRERRLYIISVFRERYWDYERSQAAVKLGENNAVNCSLTRQDRKEAVTDPPLPPTPANPPPQTHPSTPFCPSSCYQSACLLNTSSLIQAPQVYLWWGLTDCTDLAVVWRGNIGREAAGFFVVFFFPREIALALSKQWSSAN